MAMTSWQIGEKGAARRYYNDAFGWIEKGQNGDKSTIGLHAEAAELLRIDPNAPDTKME